MSRLRHPRWQRDTIIFLAGLGVFLHQALIAGAEKPTIIIGALAMMGLPVFLRTDESHKPKEDEDDVDKASR